MKLILKVFTRKADDDSVSSLIYGYQGIGDIK